MSVTVQAVRLFRSDCNFSEYENVPELIPAVPETVFSADVWLHAIHLVNESANPVTVTIADGQSPARQVVPAVTINGNSDHIREFSGGRYCPGGVKWVASAPSAVTGYLRGRQ